MNIKGKEETEKEMGLSQKRETQVTLFRRIWASMLLGISGLGLMLVNKIVLTTYKFPSYNILGTSQAIIIVVTLRIAKAIRLIDFPDFDLSIPKRVFPIPFFYISNLIIGLAATKRLNVPMFTVLRRIGILFTLILEFYMLKTSPNKGVKAAIGLIVLGSFLAAIEDLSFDLYGYILILSYDFIGALEVVYIKKKLDNLNSLGQVGILYYSVIFNVIPLCILVWITGDFAIATKFEGWYDKTFIFWFFLANFLGLLNLYSWISCTDVNSPLMSQVVSCVRSMLTTYLGMFIGGDYIYNVYNFIGLNVSLLGGFAYSYVSFKDNTKAKDKTEVEILNKGTYISKV